jgi:hypothetical protein
MSVSQSNERRYLSCAETAKLVRKALRAEFPGVKFSVRSSTYAGGTSIDVRWLDGPTAGRVDQVLDLYSGATFDGMVDLKSYHDSLLVDEDGRIEFVHFGADFVHSQRELSAEFVAELTAEIETSLGEQLDPAKHYGSVAIRGLDRCLMGPWGQMLPFQLSTYRERS